MGGFELRRRVTRPKLRILTTVPSDQVDPSSIPDLRCHQIPPFFHNPSARVNFVGSRGLPHMIDWLRDNQMARQNPIPGEKMDLRRVGHRGTGIVVLATVSIIPTLTEFIRTLQVYRTGAIPRWRWLSSNERTRPHAMGLGR